MAHALKDSFASVVDDVLRGALVTVEAGEDGVFGICNTKFEGDPTAGSVKIPVRSDMVAGAYNKSTGIAATDGDTTYITVTNFVDVAVNEIVDGCDADSLSDDIIADRLNSAGHAGAASLDSDAIATLDAEGTDAVDTAPSTDLTAYKKVVAARAQLTKNKVPSDGGRWIIVSPDFYSLLLEDKHFIKASDIGQTIVQSGFVGRVAGFNVFESAYVPADVEFIAGHYNWFTRVRAWVLTPDVFDLNGDRNMVGASAVKGRWVFKHKVTKPLSVYIKRFVGEPDTLVTGVVITSDAIAIAPGATSQVTYTVSPADADDKTVKFISSDPTKATVNPAGLVSGIAAGSAVITVITNDGSYTDSVVATVSVG